MSNIVWEVGDGGIINFWDDQWVDVKCKLIDKCVVSMPSAEKNNRVKDMVNEEGVWDMERIGRWVSKEGIKLIMVVSPLNGLHSDDFVRWDCHMQKKYSVSEMYHATRKEQDT